MSGKNPMIFSSWRATKMRGAHPSGEWDRSQAVSHVGDINGLESWNALKSGAIRSI
jgi:hypothetical protein